MDLKDFAKSQNFSNYADEINANEAAQEKAKNIYNKYKDFSKNELIEEIAKQIKTQKQNGTFNKDALLNTLNNFSAFIPQANLNELKELISKLDEQNF